MPPKEKHPELPPIPAKRYFTIGEVSELCAVKPHVLRYWEQEFKQLKPIKRRGNRRYYQHHEVLLIRRIRSLLYEEGFTINGARSKLDEIGADNKALSADQAGAEKRGKSGVRGARDESHDFLGDKNIIQPSLFPTLPDTVAQPISADLRRELKYILKVLKAGN
ncbi:MAG: MerR family transcriptional regulator [Burkholderiales bacterium]|jgi:DNA-binding transcriptional MerR regulator|nr:MerR family transcriptional regulator [Burkholderiales bacterium]